MAYLNRTYSMIDEKFVTWTTESADPEGVSYPGPGVFDEDTDGFGAWPLPGGGGGGSNQFVSSTGEWPYSSEADPDMAVGMVVYQSSGSNVSVYRTEYDTPINRILGVVKSLNDGSTVTVVYAGVLDFGEPVVPPFIREAWAGPEGFVEGVVDNEAQTSLYIGVWLSQSKLLIRIGQPLGLLSVEEG